MNKTILISGGAGFIGSHLVDRLLELNFKIIVLDNLSTGRIENISTHRSNSNFTFYQGDICDPIEWIFEKHEIDSVFHLAAIGRVRYSFFHPIKTHKTNVTGSLNLLESSQKYNVKRFIFASSSSVYGSQDKLPLTETMNPNPLSPYGLQKMQAEQYVNWFAIHRGLNATSLRFFNVYGPRQRGDLEHSPLIPKVLRSLHRGQSPIIFGEGNNTRDFTYVSDIIDGILLAAFSNNLALIGQIVNIGNGKNYSVREIINRLLAVDGRELKPEFRPPVNEPSHTLADLTRARELLEFVPKVNLDTGLELCLQKREGKGYLGTPT